MNDIQNLKEILRIPEVWNRLGLHGTPGKSCRSPFRPDKSASFSIFDDGRQWKDHATGAGGDVIDFIALACKVDAKEATRRFLAMAGAPVSGIVATPESRKNPAPTLTLPPLHGGTLEEIEQVARSRCLHFDAVSLACCLGTVAFGDVCGFPCWILTDAAHRIAEARRVDGKPFPAVGTLGERKAHTLKGSVKAWPAGVAVLENGRNYRAVMLVEGGPDYIAALHFAITGGPRGWDVLPVAILGRNAGTRIDPHALELLKGLRIRIYPHRDADGGGMARAQIWAKQLHSIGCDVDFFDFTGLSRRDGEPVNDLNDAAVIAPVQQNELLEVLP